MLLQLLQFRPAIMAVWLARKAGEAYEFGTFWDLFEGKLGIQIPPSERRRFADEFKDACMDVMSDYTFPTSLGAFKYVETFLFQAGLPLCHCQRFADCLREVERRYGLPDPDSPEAGQELQEALLTYGGFRIAAPTLKRAVQGPAGPFICQAALEVLLEVATADINPKLREALERAFANQRASQLRRSARQPYPRLSQDLGSLEIVGPRQDGNLVSQNGLVWVANGARYPTPYWDEFVFPVRGESRVNVELLGLRGGQALSRTFSLRVSDLEQPFLVFDAATRRFRRPETGQAVRFKSGSYWVLHPVQYRVSPGSVRYEWLDGRHAVSLMQLRPGSGAQLEGQSTWSFKPDQSPFCEIRAESLVSDEGERLYYGWREPIEVWLPLEAVESRRAGWSLHVSAAGIEENRSLVEAEYAADMMRCRVDVSQFLARLWAGLHRLEISISRPGRKSDCSHQLWFWAGLEAYDEGRSFRVAVPPQNLLLHKCQGFSIADRAIAHKRTDSPRHTLTFDVSGTPREFQWSQIGVYLESFEKKAGQTIRPQAHRLGDTFSASIDSLRYLRIWQIPAAEAALLVNRQQVQHVPAESARPWLDLSLAHLSTLFPNGGEVVLSSQGHESTIARFTRPLIPLRVDITSGGGHRCLNLSFADRVRWVRPRVREIVAGRTIDWEGEGFDSSGRCVFRSDLVPQVDCSSLNTESGNWPDGLNATANVLAGQDWPEASSQDDHPITLNVPDDGWPAGLWLVELQVRRSESADWQVVTSEDGRLIPLLVAGTRSEVEDVRQKVLLGAYQAGTIQPGSPLSLTDLAASHAELFELLAEISLLVERGFAPEVREQFGWLEHLFHELGRLTGKTLGAADRHHTANLLDLACIETVQVDGGSLTRRSLFVTVPELLALPTDHYAGISANQPLAQSLRWCARLSAHDLVFDAFRDLLAEVCANPCGPAPDMFRVLRHFRNFTDLLQTSDPRASTDDFAWFDYDRYFRQTIGLLQQAQPQPEWDERSALGRAHIEWALSKFAERRRSASENLALGAVNALLDTAPVFRTWLRQNLKVHSTIMPSATWGAPWLTVSFDDDDLMENCCRFASVFALAARAAGAGWLSFESVIAWLTEHGAARQADEATIATLVGMGPELFGYYLMFWELMIRAYPHD
jgi:hypothetical protein